MRRIECLADLSAEQRAKYLALVPGNAPPTSWRRIATNLAIGVAFWIGWACFVTWAVETVLWGADSRHAIVETR